MLPTRADRVTLERRRSRLAQRLTLTNQTSPDLVEQSGLVETVSAVWRGKEFGYWPNVNAQGAAWTKFWLLLALSSAFLGPTRMQ